MSKQVRTAAGKAGAEGSGRGSDQEERAWTVPLLYVSRIKAPILVPASSQSAPLSAYSLRSTAFPGCTHTRYVDHHHIRRWADGGETSADNLINLCRFHHRLVHEGGFEVISGQGTGDSQSPIRFKRPDGSIIDSRSPQSSGCATFLPACHEQRDIRITPTTAVSRWQGERMDYGLGVEVLMQRWRKGKKCTDAADVLDR